LDQKTLGGQLADFELLVRIEFAGAIQSRPATQNWYADRREQTMFYSIDLDL